MSVPVSELSSLHGSTSVQALIFNGVCMMPALAPKLSSSMVLLTFAGNQQGQVKTTIFLFL